MDEIRERISPQEASPRWPARLVDALPTVAGISAAAVGTAVTVAWYVHADIVERGLPGMHKMEPLTALALLTAGLSLLALHRGEPRWARTGRGLSLALAAMTLLTLFEYAFGRHLDLDWVLPHDRPGLLTSADPGRPSLDTALALFLLAGALWTIVDRHSAVRRFSRSAATAGGMLAVLALAERIYGVEQHHTRISGSTDAMAIHAGLTLLLLSAGIVCFHPDEGIGALLQSKGPAGTAVRWLVPAAIGCPVLLGALALGAVRLDWVGIPTAFALSAIAAVTAGVVLISFAARSLMEGDRVRTESEERLRLSERRYAQAYAREREAAERLQAVDEMKNTFLHAVSHELRTPLTVISGFSSMLEEDDETPPETTRDWARRIGTNARRLQRLLGDLLDLDRFERGLVRARRRPTTARHLIDTVLADTDTADHPVFIEADVGVVLVDTAQLERIVENLVLNAVRHTPAGTPIWVRARRDEEGGLILSVEDAGPGVPDAIKGVIFEAFRQGGRDAAPRGTGVGLSLVESFARLHGGRAWVEDRPGGGACFKVHLPLWAERGRRTMVVDWANRSQLCADFPKRLAISQCTGPGSAPIVEHCPGDGTPCELARTADAIVVCLPTDESSYAPGATDGLVRLAKGYAAARPTIPVIVEVPAGSKPEAYQSLLGGGCIAVPASVTEEIVEDTLMPASWPPTRAPR